MGLVRSIRRFSHRTSESTGLVFYSKPRRLALRYEAMITNSSNSSKRYTACIPLPPTTNVQTLLGEPSIQPQPSTIETDERFGNRYAVLQGTLKPGAVAAWHESFVITVNPFRPTLTKSHTLNAYATIPADVRERYCTPDRFIRAEDPRIRQLAEALRGKETSVITILKRLNRHVVTHLTYGDPIMGLYSSDDALTKPKVDCGGFDTLLAALAMSLGIPTRIVSGFWAVKKTGNDMHAWVEFMLPDGTWLPADPSVEQLVRQVRSKHSGRFGFVGSDRVALSYGCDIPVQVDGQRVSADILQHPFVWSDQGMEGLTAVATLRVPKVWRT